MIGPRGDPVGLAPMATPIYDGRHMSDAIDAWHDGSRHRDKMLLRPDIRVLVYNMDHIKL